MRATAPFLTVAGTTLGVVAAVVAYQAGAGTAASSGKQQPPATANPAPTPVAQTRFLPCEKGTRLRHGVCVRVKKRVVVVTDPAPAAAYAPATSGGATAGRVEGSGFDHAQHGSSSDGAGEHEAEPSDASGQESAHEPEHEMEPGSTSSGTAEHHVEPGDD